VQSQITKNKNMKKLITIFALCLLLAPLYSQKDYTHGIHTSIIRNSDTQVIVDFTLAEHQKYYGKVYFVKEIFNSYCDAYSELIVKSIEKSRGDSYETWLVIFDKPGRKKE